MNELKGALRAGDIWVRDSRRYKNFDDYLMPGGDFDKLLNNNQLNISVETECGAYLKARLTLLASRLEEVNAMAVTGDLPDMDISDKGLKVTPLDNRVLSAISPLADLIYNMLPHPKITEILDEVERWTAFTRHFTHLKNPLTRPQDDCLLLTTILADGINLGLTKMAESCPGTTRASLENMQAWYIRDETYSAALAELVNAQKSRPLAALWGDGSASSSDGQNFRVGSHGRYAGQVNLKYGQKPGVQFYTHISDQYSPFYTKVISRVRDSTHVLDGLLYHESVIERTGFNGLIIHDDRFVVLDMIMPVDTQLNAVRGGKVHRFQAGFVLIALFIDHYAHLNAPLFRVHQRLSNIGGLEGVSYHADRLLRPGDNLQHQRPRRAFRRKANLNVRCGNGRRRQAKGNKQKSRQKT